MQKMIFVFGSNESGIHGAGAAATARIVYGAVVGVGFGPTGETFAIPTKSWGIKKSLELKTVSHYIDRFIAFAKMTESENPKIEFQVTKIGCGYAGFKAEQIAPLFLNAPGNCLFDSAWKSIFDKLEKQFPQVATKRYWGTF